MITTTPTTPAAPITGTTVATPCGPLALLTRHDVLLAAGWCPPEDLYARLQRRPGGAPGPLVPGEPGLVDAAVQSWLDGERTALDSVPVHQTGTPHQVKVWQALREIPAGATTSYGLLAQRLGTSARALGTACGANLVAPVVPCHRVVRGDGALGGYHYGLATKRWLLGFEDHGVVEEIQPPPMTV
jgi:methylated-DNA-[protein]-cysteine S-methyltransferase